MRNLVVVVLGAAVIAAAPEVAAEPATALARQPRGLAVGVEVGQPTSATVAWFALEGRIAAALAVGTGTWAGPGLSVRAELIATPKAFAAGRVLLLPHVGIGVRHRRHQIDPASIDEVDDAHTGVRASFGLGGRMAAPLELYLEIAPGYDFRRTDSCSVASGVESLCPHAQSSRGFFEAGLGVRWFFEQT